MVSQMMKYLGIAAAFLSVWLVLPWDYVLVAYAPVIVVILIGIYAVLSVLYGVATFNDCEYAKVSLQKEIQEAKADLSLKRIIDSN
ncbi:hypothetical protein L596_004332 [Steinernema carpocapsae]|uniref:Dolichol-phosphate mannosyltransferase subunit 3 n=1 Tax=Steinernema carpocapsae TaxID=34508 RepID=A0A4U8UVH7_STECR|nr:hypothetical protein L596_004332 [Steinernema carpocapsae]